MSLQWTNVALLTDVSGNHPSFVSGILPVNITGGTNVSGQSVQITNTSPSALIIPEGTKNIITAASGGTQLLSASGQSTSCVSLLIRNNSGNSAMYVGSQTTAPFSGRGFIIGGGDGLTLNVDDISETRVCAVISGQRLSYIWSQL